MKGKVIIYDDNCPMCCAYTQAFVKTGLLEKEGRIPFSQLEESGYACQLDMHRSRHEIPLVDKHQGNTLYGLNSMLTILEQKIPFLVKIARFKPIYLCLEQFYKFISYNRSIIAAQVPKSEGFDCSPDFHWVYRLAYLLFAFGFVGFVFSQIRIDFFSEVLLIGLLFCFTSLFSFRKNLWDWLGHLATSLLIGAMFMGFFLLIPNSPLFVLTFVFLGLVFSQLIHRIRLMGY